jgi:predicted 2-oxoglutarate/Fe(II)-dependent dioxygenase YbiX
MRNVKVAYNEEQAPLEVLLRTIDRPGDYCTQGRLLVPMPRVEVEGARSLSFPVTEEQARTLTAVAERAPYGRGEQTLVDSSVRACWQIDAARVRVTGGAWRDTLAQVVGRAATGLGCPPEHTSAHLYKLLVYEPGGFFAPHRDTEKVDGMVATLVLSLPVAGAGGELVIRHRQRSTIVDLRTDEPSELAFAAFYADCVHEIRPVTAGYRIVLVYHLVVRGAAAAVLRAAPDFASQEEAIAARLWSWESASAAGDKLVWLLEHQYSQAGLSFDVLKNADAALGRVLAGAAQRADHALYAGILSIHESGTVDEDALYYDWDEDDDESDDWDNLEYMNSTRSLFGLVAADGSRPDYGELPLLPGELLPSGALDDVEPDDEDRHVTGNEGVQVSRSYRRAALVLWPPARTLGTLARASIERAVAVFEDELARSEDDAAPRRRLPGLAAQLVDTWPAPDDVRFYRRDDADGVPHACRDMLRLLRRLGDEATTRRFLCEVATPHYSGGETDELLATVAAIAPATLHAWLPQFTERNLPLVPEDVLDLLGRLCPQGEASAGSDRHPRPALADAARALCRGLPAVVGVTDPDTEVDRLAAGRLPVRPLSASAIRSLFAFLWHCAPPADAEAAAALLVQHPTAPPYRAVPEALAKLAELRGTTGDAAEPGGFVTLWRHAADFLLARSAAPPEEPADWVIEVSIPHRCALCARLQAFCDSPEATTERFRARQDLREHVESMIARQRLDIGCKTERTGSPHTLICTKNRATYRRRCAEYAADVAHMRLLVAAAPRRDTHAGCAADLQRLRQAIADEHASDG